MMVQAVQLLIQEAPLASTVDLNTLAQIWVERWLAYGGGLILSADKLQISMSERGWRQEPAGDQQYHRDSARWHDAWQTGRWRELSELAGQVPGLREAIRSHVGHHGERGADGRRIMYRPTV